MRKDGRFGRRLWGNRPWIHHGHLWRWGPGRFICTIASQMQLLQLSVDGFQMRPETVSVIFTNSRFQSPKTTVRITENLPLFRQTCTGILRWTRRTSTASMTNPEAGTTSSKAGPELMVSQVRDALASLYDLPCLQSHPLARLLAPVQH